ncbi:hypothetical protein PMAYCL1PPCAC_23148 [Pristionchus mayeri]|uniref:diphosphoinositol-polyphosphate diphosphatase n=1 Tax=Pristionchus mayeri TaxID=1317129 RepID=A0AAN5CXX4_9BILA|nr:hypothetical protein PMAYCL1PPCAC_23148 [Pristionchus mayeri]
MHHDRVAHKSRTNGERQRDHEGFRLRSAGVCMRGEGRETRLLLVSGGKDGEKWVVPGGGIEKGEAAEEAAVRELEEEAGVRAETKEIIGVFQDDNRKHRTRVFVMIEREEMAEWDDGRFGRRRCWMPIVEALTKVKESHIAILRRVMDHYGIPPPS